MNAQQITINEIMSNNATIVADEDGDNPDWIELHNNSSEIIDLSGYGMSDDPNMPLKWVFGKYLLNPNEYLIVWCSDKDLQAGVYFPDEVSGLLAWFKADDINTLDTNQVTIIGNDIFVKKWISHNGQNYAAQSTVINRPLFVQSAIEENPVLRFDGINHLLISDLTPPLGNHTRTIIVMLSNANMTNGNTAPNNHILQYGDYGNTYGLTCKPITSGALIGNSYWSSFFYGIGKMDSEPKFITVVYSGSSDNFFVNGHFAGTNFISLNTSPNFTMRIASRIGNGMERFAGDISEIIVYDTLLTKEQRRRVENYLAQKFKLPFQSFHTNFKLSSEGDFIVLANPDGDIIDQVVIPELAVDYSYGKSPNGLSFYLTPTPGDENITQAFTEIMKPPAFSHEAGFYTDTVHLSLLSDDPETTILYTLDGSDPDINAIGGIEFPVKYDYSVCNAGELITRQNETHIYEQPLELAPKYNFPNDRSQIQASYLNWLPPTSIVTKATVVKASSWKAGAINSKIVTKTFLVDSASMNMYQLPVVSIVITDYNLFNYDTGIYVPGQYYDQTCNTGQIDANFRHDDWERSFHFELFDNQGNLEFHQNGGVRIHGNFSSNWARKSLRCKASSRYGDDGIFNFALFPGLKQNPMVGNEELDEFNEFIIRNSGNNWWNNLFLDAMVHRLVNHLPSDGQASRAVVHFLNSEYWGIMNLREKHDEYYFAGHYNLDPEDVIIANARTESVTTGYAYEYQHYSNIENFVINNSLVDSGNYNYLNTQMDIEDYMIHFMIEIYINNTDFLGNNRKFWRKRTPQYMPYSPLGHDGRWRWILYDTDQSFADPDYDRLTSTTTGNANSSRILRKLLENPDFENTFINSFCDNMNTTFLPERVIHVIDSMKINMDHDIIEHIERWNNIGPDQNCAEMIEFAQIRPYFMRKHLKDRFQLSDSCMITVNTEIEKGTIKVNSIKINQNTIGLQNPAEPFPWSGLYFVNVPTRLVATAKEGFVFSHWSNGENNDTIFLNPSSDTTVFAFFEPGQPSTDSIVINEINYNSASNFNPGDWIEFYNPQDFDLNISNWFFKDEDDEHTFIFPENTIITALDYLVLCETSYEFSNLFPDVDHFIGDLDFGFSGSGELLRLFNSSGALVDTVHYDDTAPWPAGPDGNGPSLELISPNLDNALGQSWMSSTEHGTPGTMNSLLLNTNKQIPENVEFSVRIYPNPLNATAVIEINSSKNIENLEFSVYNLFGTLLKSAEYQNTTSIIFDKEDFKPGIYLIHITSGTKFSTWSKIVIE
jgi:hypothetical protein